MSSIIKSIGHGLLAAGILLALGYAFCCYLIAPELLHDAFNPLAPKTYLVLLPLASGSLLVWLSNNSHRDRS
jgi:hypothetical protein